MRLRFAWGILELYDPISVTDISRSFAGNFWKAVG